MHREIFGELALTAKSIPDKTKALHSWINEDVWVFRPGQDIVIAGSVILLLGRLPIVTSIILSLILTVVLNLLLRMFNR